MSAPDARSVRSNWESEVRMAGVYEALAGTTRDTGLKHRLMSLAETEKRHADAWAALMDSGGEKPRTPAAISPRGSWPCWRAWRASAPRWRWPAQPKDRSCGPI